MEQATIDDFYKSKPEAISVQCSLAPVVQVVLDTYRGQCSHSPPSTKYSAALTATSLSCMQENYYLVLLYMQQRVVLP